MQGSEVFIFEAFYSYLKTRINFTFPIKTYNGLADKDSLAEDFLLGRHYEQHGKKVVLSMLARLLCVGSQVFSR